MQGNGASSLGEWEKKGSIPFENVGCWNYYLSHKANKIIEDWVTNEMDQWESMRFFIINVVEMSCKVGETETIKKIQITFYAHKTANMWVPHLFKWFRF